MIPEKTLLSDQQIEHLHYFVKLKKICFILKNNLDCLLRGFLVTIILVNIGLSPFFLR